MQATSTSQRLRPKPLSHPFLCLNRPPPSHSTLPSPPRNNPTSSLLLIFPLKAPPPPQTRATSDAPFPSVDLIPSRDDPPRREMAALPPSPFSTSRVRLLLASRRACRSGRSSTTCSTPSRLRRGKSKRRKSDETDDRTRTLRVGTRRRDR
jgi:hypothetical protein